MTDTDVDGQVSEIRRQIQRMDGVCVHHPREYVPPGQLLVAMLTLRADMKFILLHETKNDDGIRSFFHDVWELYLKVSHSQKVLLF
jgi:hypothetical protein